MTRAGIPLLAAALLAAGAPEARAQEALSVAIYAPSVSFSDSGARLAFVQGLARAIERKTGIPTTGKAYVRFGDLAAARPDFAILDALCIAARSPGEVLATASIGGAVAQRWALYARERSFAALAGKKLAVVATGCRDADFVDHAMLASEVAAGSFFGALIDKPDVTGAVAAVKDFKTVDAVFAPASAARGLTRVFEAAEVPNPGFVALSRRLPRATIDRVRDAVLAHGAGAGIAGFRAPASYAALAGRLAARPKRALFAAPEPVRLDDTDVLVVPRGEPRVAPVGHHFWEPPTP